MVDNENQWEELEYSDDSTQYYHDDSLPKEDTNNTNSEYSEEDYENDYEDTEDGYDDDSQEDEGRSSKKSNLLPVIILALLLLGMGGFFAVSKLSNNANSDSKVADNQSAIQNDTLSESQNEDDTFFNQDNQASSGDMMSVDFNENGDAEVKGLDDTEENVATIKNSSEDNDLFSNANDFEGIKTNENNDIIVSYDKSAARINPFKPPFSDKQINMAKLANVQNTEFEIIEPPTASVADTNLTRLLQTQISGILYDDESPSAIVNLDGLDTFVKAGDTIHGYTIQTITKNKVQITYRNNTYVAAVGELFTPGTIDKPAVANLEKKFAGRYK